MQVNRVMYIKKGHGGAGEGALGRQTYQAWK